MSVHVVGGNPAGDRVVDAPAAPDPSADSAADVAYCETTDFEWTKRAFALLDQQVLVVTPQYADGVVSVVVTGPCPRCHHEIVERWVDTVITGVGAGARGALRDGGPSDVLEVDVTCRCGIPHAHAPEHAVGCGASFRIELQAAGDNDENAPTS